jgi:hypothetical protein
VRVPVRSGRAGRLNAKRAAHNDAPRADSLDFPTKPHQAFSTHQHHHPGLSVAVSLRLLVSQR